MRALAILVLLVNLAAFSPAQIPPRCVVCQTLISGRYFWLSRPTAEEKLPICEACSRIDTRCALCRLPVRNGHKLDDGRWFCDKDFAAGIFSQPEALRIYEEVRRELQGVLAGTGELPGDNIRVALVDASQLRKLNQALPSDHDDSSLLGLTRTLRQISSKRYQHSIYLVSGLNRARLAAVCAHEYTHTWLHENVPQDRGLERDTVEGFCELVAYKLMTQRHDELEKSVILANAYTRGQVNAFIQAEGVHHFQRIVRWLKTGVDEVLTNPEPSLALRDDGPAPVLWPPPAYLPTPVPDTLTLRGISGGRARRFVLINDCTLTKNEEGRVRLATSNVVVRCVDIRDHSAVIQVKGTPGATELFLGSN